MKAILGLIHPDAGMIEILGDTTLSSKTRAQIGFMPENTYLYKYLTGREFLRFNGKFFDINEVDLEAKIDELLHKVGLDTAGDRLLAKYSKGMLQRIGLAQAIINNPSVVFLDEPMSGLDPIGRKMIKDLILELKINGTTVFFNTHILSDVESICDRFAIIHQGYIIADESVHDINKPLEEYFIECINENTE
jgi:ABC-2 type transport system ATP-binding protein